jgi:hypothetical protein
MNSMCYGTPCMSACFVEKLMRSRNTRKYASGKGLRLTSQGKLNSTLDNRLVRVSENRQSESGTGHILIKLDGLKKCPD